MIRQILEMTGFTRVLGTEHKKSERGRYKKMTQAKMPEKKSCKPRLKKKIPGEGE